MNGTTTAERFEDIIYLAMRETRLPIARELLLRAEKLAKIERDAFYTLVIDRESIDDGDKTFEDLLYRGRLDSINTLKKKLELLSEPQADQHGNVTFGRPTPLRTIHFIGENVVDLECVLEETPQGVKFAEGVVDNKNIKYMEIPEDMNIYIRRDSKYYLLKIDIDKDLIKHSKELKAPEGKIRLPIDGKYYMDGELEHVNEMPDSSKSMVVEFKSEEGGGGAFNAFREAVVFAERSISHLVDVDAYRIGTNLMAMCADSRIKRLLNLNKKTGMDNFKGKYNRNTFWAYSPVCPMDMAGTNVNITSSEIRKMTFRAKLQEYDNNYLIGDNIIKPDDTVVVISIKNEPFLDMVEDILKKSKPKKVVLANSDSMIKSLKSRRIMKFIRGCDYYVSNTSELEKLFGLGDDRFKTDEELYEAMGQLHSKLRRGGKVYITNEERGATVMHEEDRKSVAYFQSTRGLLSPVNEEAEIKTSRTGDIFAAVMSYLETVGDYTTAQILNASNVASQFRAFNNKWPKLGDVRDFNRKHMIPILVYNPSFKQFEPCGYTNCI